MRRMRHTFRRRAISGGVSIFLTNRDRVVARGFLMFPFWCELSGSQLLQWTTGAVTLLVCLVNLAAGLRSN